MNRAAVTIEKRAVSKARREAVIARQGGICKRANCEAPATDADHIIPLWCGGSNRDENLEGLCGPCHARKTKAEASARAKAKRIVARAEGTRRERQPIPSRGFGTQSRKMNGSIGLTRKALRYLEATTESDDERGGYGADVIGGMNHD